MCSPIKMMEWMSSTGMEALENRFYDNLHLHSCIDSYHKYFHSEWMFLYKNQIGSSLNKSNLNLNMCCSRNKIVYTSMQK